MRYLLLTAWCSLLWFGVVEKVTAQVWKPVGATLPLPQAPQPLMPGTLGTDQQARTRAQNQAPIDEVDTYTAQQARREQLLEEARQDIARMERERQEQAEFNTQFEARNKPQYEAAYQALAEMLDGRRKPSLPFAVFLVENSYEAGQLNYPAFDDKLKSLADICCRLTGNDTRPAARFMALHRLMTDTVRLARPGLRPMRHLPYRYDFQDFRGEQDYRKLFVTKLLQTNSGQCHSLPLLYKMLADQLGVKACISLSPNHSYIQVVGPDGGLYSYETTNGHFTTDAFYMTSGYVKTAALKSRAYLDTLTWRQTIAYQVSDLALGYAHYYGEDEFTEKCAALTLKHYPQSIQARMILHNSALARFARAYRVAGSPAKEQAMQLPTLKPLWAAVMRWQRELDVVGFEEIPPEQYARWLKSAQDAQQLEQSKQAATNFLKTAAKPE